MLIIVCTDVELGIPPLSSRQICYQAGAKIHIFILLVNISPSKNYALHIKLIYRAAIVPCVCMR